jgi:hypothetical protein
LWKADSNLGRLGSITIVAAVVRVSLRQGRTGRWVRHTRAR